MNKRILGISAVAGLLAFAGVALAQSITLPTVAPAATDYTNIVQNGQPTAQAVYSKLGNISGVELYKNGGTITTDPAFTFTNGLVLYTAHKASGLTTATITTEPNPSDGKRECYYLDQTTTTLTWTANSASQTIGTGVQTAGVANAAQCIIYSSATATWYGSN